MDRFSSGCTSTINQQTNRSEGTVFQTLSYQTTLCVLWFQNSRNSASTLVYVISRLHHITLLQTGWQNEPYIQSKSWIKRMANCSIEHNLLHSLFVYRRTPHSTTGMSPSELLMNRKLKSRLDLIRPGIKTNVTSKQQIQKDHHGFMCIIVYSWYVSSYILWSIETI